MRKLVALINDMSPIGAVWAGVVTGIPLGQGVHVVYTGEPMGRALFFGLLQLLILLGATYLIRLMMRLL